LTSIVPLAEIRGERSVTINGTNFNDDVVVNAGPNISRDECRGGERNSRNRNVRDCASTAPAGGTSVNWLTPAGGTAGPQTSSLSGPPRLR
jgi:hypothetical protein